MPTMMVDEIHWHAEPTGWAIRGYTQPDGYERKLAFVVVCTAAGMGEGTCYIGSFLRVDGAHISIRDMRGIARLLREKHGMKTIHWRHRGKPLSYPTSRF